MTIALALILSISLVWREIAAAEPFTFGAWAVEMGYRPFQFTTAEAERLRAAGINLLIKTRRVGPQGGLASQDYEEAIVRACAATPPLRFVPEYEPEGSIFLRKWHLRQYAWQPHPLNADDRALLARAADSLLVKWGRPEYAPGIYGFIVGHEAYNRRGYAEGGWRVMADNLAMVVDTLRSRDPDARLVDVGNVRSARLEGTRAARFRALFRKTHPPNVFMHEDYLLYDRDDSPGEIQRALGTLAGGYDLIADTLRVLAGEGYRTEWHAIIQAHNHDGTRAGTYRYPTRSELLAQAFLALSRGARGIIVYRLDSNVADDEYGLFDLEGRPTAMYHHAKVLGEMLGRLGPTLQRLRWLDAFSADAAPDTSLVRGVDGRVGPVELGVFADSLGTPHLLVVNRDVERAQTLGLVLDPEHAVPGLAVVEVGGGEAWVVGERGSVHDVYVLPGRGRLLKLLTRPPQH